MASELTHIRSREIEKQIKDLADEAGLRVIVLNPLISAQDQASQIWRLATDLRSSLRAAQDLSLEPACEMIIKTSLHCLDYIEHTLYPGEELEMTESTDS